MVLRFGSGLIAIWRYADWEKCDLWGSRDLSYHIMFCVKRVRRSCDLTTHLKGLPIHAEKQENKID